MIVFDTHCDTITKLYDDNIALYKNNIHVDIERMLNYEGFVQFFAIWINPNRKKTPLDYFYDLYNVFISQLSVNSNFIELVTDTEQAQKAIKNGRIAAFLSVEGGEALQGNISNLDILYRLGVRSMTLTWNHKNELGTGVLDESFDEGITPFGFEVIKRMNEKSIIIDVSHLTERCFWDVMDNSSKSVIASHSNSYSICKHKRNLTDNQFKAIANKDGVVGINLYSTFLNNIGIANVDDVIKHIDHFMALGGENNIGLGADFDGVDKTPCGINGIEDLYIICETLLKLNYSQEQVEKITSGNYMNFIKTFFD